MLDALDSVGKCWKLSMYFVSSLTSGERGVLNRGVMSGVCCVVGEKVGQRYDD